MKSEDLEGWRAKDTPLDGYASEGEIDISKLVHAQNRKKQRSGGFQTFGLSRPVLQGVLRKGYNVPTPIQRKTIPVILEGKDVVAMARTGSGKTAAFLVPLFEKLKVHSAKVGARALIISPTRELALQTLQFAKELGKFTGLRATSVLGGESIENQFAALHENPDLILATPGRFTHVCAEMNLKLDTIEYVVFDEADRLFEMGFQEQLNDILARLSPLRQTLLFSATLPKLLVEFAKAGLSDPTLIRLDVDTKISENLKLGFFKVNSEDKVPLLIHLLKTVIRPTEPTVIFVPTKYHVDYLHQVLNAVDLDSTFIFSSLDPSARKINIAKFRMKRVNLLLVTDVAARGIDIPLLDHVINFNFPPKTKLFVHRVGRVARAGRKGTAFSFVAPDELSYLLELHMFLSRSIRFCPMLENNLHPPLEDSEDWDRLLGRVPQDIIDDNAGSLRKMLELSFDLKTLKTSADNALQKYARTRPSPSTESSRRLKEEFWGREVGFHPIFKEFWQPKVEEERIKLLEKLRNVRPKATIFEIRGDKKKTDKKVLEPESVMAEKRKVDGAKIEEFYSKMKRRKMVMEEATEQQLIAKRERSSVTESSEVEVLSAFKSVIGKRRKGKDAKVASVASSVGIVTEKEKDSPQEHFIPYLPPDFYTNQSYSVMSNFERESAAATFDIVGDDTNPHNKKRVQMKWDRKQKKFKGQDQPKMIKTESGAWVPATYKKDLYQTWKMKMQPEQNEQVEGERDDEEDGGTADQKRNWRTQHKGKNAKKNTGFISLTEVSSRNKPHPLMQGKKEAPMKCPKKGHLQLRTYEQTQKEVKRKAKVRQFHKEREAWKKKKKAKRNTGGKPGFKRRY